MLITKCVYFHCAKLCIVIDQFLQLYVDVKDYFAICSGLSTFPTSDINCGEISHECLGCCNYTQYLTCPDAPSNIQASADEGSILVLRCCKCIVMIF